MVQSISKRSRKVESSTAVCDVLLVRVPPEMVTLVPPDLLSRAESGRETLALLKLTRFRILLTSLDVPDMPPWELFRQARRMQSQLQCVLMDERLTPEDERRLRQTGAGAFATSDPAIFAAAVRPAPP
jgi:DNA-binding NarL/FixJ family response regulator